MTDPLFPNEELNRLERQVDNLIALVHLLGNENKALKTQQSNWTVERAKLIEKNELEIIVLDEKLIVNKNERDSVLVEVGRMKKIVDQHKKRKNTIE